MNAWKVILATLLIFGTGVVTGGLVVGRAKHGPRLGLRPTRQVGLWQQPGPAFRLEFLRRAQRELDLTAEQREKVEDILSESAQRSRVLMEPVASNLRQELDRAREEFRKILNPVQRERFDDLMRQRAREQRRDKGLRRVEEPSATRHPNATPKEP